MERSAEFEAFIRGIMPDASNDEREIAMQNMDDYIRLLMRMAERAERIAELPIRGNPDQRV